MLSNCRPGRTKWTEVGVRTTGKMSQLASDEAFVTVPLYTQDSGMCDRCSFADTCILNG